MATRHPDDIMLGTEVVLSRDRLSPLEIARRCAAGRFEAPAIGKGEALLEVGGVVVAAGRIVTRGGRRYLRIRRLFGAAGGEVRS